MAADPLTKVILNPGVGGNSIGTDTVPVDDGTIATTQVEVHKILNGDQGVNGGFVTPDNPFPSADTNSRLVLERIAQSLDMLLEIELGRGGDLPRGTIVDSQGAPVTVRQAKQRALYTDRSLITQIHPAQQPIPTTAMPANGTSYRYQGYVAGTTAFQYVGVPENEIFANVTTPVLVSSSASDAAGGTGIRKIVIQYFDQNLRGPYFVVATMNGTTPVPLQTLLPSPMCFVETMYGIEFGSNFKAVGNIQLLSVTAGTLVVQINSNDTMSYQTRHYIPKGITSYITDASIVASTTGIALAFVGATPFFDATNNFGAETTVLGTFGGPNQYFCSTPAAIQGPARFYMQALNGTAGGTLWGTVGFFDAPTNSIGQNPGVPITGLNSLPLNNAASTPLGQNPNYPQQ